MEIKYDAFLSHNQADKPRVRRQADRLQAAGRKPKAEGRTQNEEILHSFCFIHLSPAVGLEPQLAVSRSGQFRSPLHPSAPF